MQDNNHVQATTKNFPTQYFDWNIFQPRYGFGTKMSIVATSPIEVFPMWISSNKQVFKLII